MFVRQTSFLGGELSPYLWGRTDLPRFLVGLRRCKNFFVSREGAAVSRPGTKLVATSPSVMPLSGRGRLIPFVFSDEQSYVLEFGHQYIRFYTGGGTIESSPGVPYQVTTPYAWSDLDKLQWAQTGDILTITHPGHEARELRRGGHADWTLSVISFWGKTPFFADVGDEATLTFPFMFVHGDGSGSSLPPLPTPDAEHPAREWSWLVSTVGRDTVAGVIFETFAEEVEYAFNGIDATTRLPIADEEAVVYPDKSLILRRATPAVHTRPSDWGTSIILGFNIYRGRGDLFGLIGTTKTRDFVDVGAEPNYAIQPFRRTNPFAPADWTSSPVWADYPSAIAFFQERRVFGGSTVLPGRLWFSATGNYTNYDERFGVHVESEALIYELASRRLDDIRHMVALGRLIIFTGSNVWTMSGAEGAPLTHESVDARIVDEVGSSHLPSLVVEGTALFSRTKGTGVRAVIPSGGEFAVADVSMPSQHLFTGADNAIKDWAYAEDPWGLVWVVRSDGTLLSLTYSPKDNTYAWAQHETDGVVEAVCSVPEGSEDAVYLLVRRSLPASSQVYRRIERMGTRVETQSPADYLALDCAATYTGVPTQTITGLAHLEGKTVYASGYNTPVYGPFTVTGGAIDLGEVPDASYFVSTLPYITLHVGLPFTPELETLDVAHTEARLRQKRVVSVGFEVSSSRGISVGQDFNHLAEGILRTVAAGYGAPAITSELVEVHVAGTFDNAARAALRQTHPLPVTVLGLTRRLDAGE